MILYRAIRHRKGWQSLVPIIFVLCTELQKSKDHSLTLIEYCFYVVNPPVAKAYSINVKGFLATQTEAKLRRYFNTAFDQWHSNILVFEMCYSCMIRELNGPRERYVKGARDGLFGSVVLCSGECDGSNYSSIYLYRSLNELFSSLLLSYLIALGLHRATPLLRNRLLFYEIFSFKQKEKLSILASLKSPRPTCRVTWRLSGAMKLIVGLWENLSRGGMSSLVVVSTTFYSIDSSSPIWMALASFRAAIEGGRLGSGETLYC